ncbi:MAG: PEP-CTERM sorting domain-containing protein [Planctomycetota bacterium]
MDSQRAVWRRLAVFWLAALLLCSARGRADLTPLRLTDNDDIDRKPRAAGGSVYWTHRYDQTTGYFQALRYDPVGGTRVISGANTHVATTPLAADDPYVAWHEGTGAGFDVWVYDSATDTAQNVSGPPSSTFSEVDMAGSHAAWLEGSIFGNAVYSYAHPGGTPQLIADTDEFGPYTRSHLDVYGSNLVWQGSPPIGSGASTANDIYLHTGSGNPLNITSDADLQQQPFLTQDHVLYTDDRWNDSTLWLYDIDAGTHARLTETDNGLTEIVDSVDPATNRFVYRQAEYLGTGWGPWDLRLFDGTSVQTLTDDAASGVSQFGASLSGNRVAWSESDGTNPSQIYLYDLSTGVKTPVTAGTVWESYQHASPHLDGDTLTWVGYIPSSNQMDSEIFYLDLSPDPPVADPGGPYGGLWGDELTFDASDSYDPDGDAIDAWEWDLEGDGSVEYTTETVSFTIPDAWANFSHHALALRVRAEGLWSQWATTDIYVSPEPATVVLLGGAVLAVLRRRRR